MRGYLAPPDLRLSAFAGGLPWRAGSWTRGRGLAGTSFGFVLLGRLLGGLGAVAWSPWRPRGLPRLGGWRPIGSSSCLARAIGQILRSSQRGQSGSPSTQVSWASSSIRSRNSTPRFLGTARSRTARSAGIGRGSAIPSRSRARRVGASTGIAWPPRACWITVAGT